nr:hypothetical protein [Paraburkholderia aspalathi]
MTIEGGHDDITGCGPSEAAQPLCTCIPAGRKWHMVTEDTGHYDTFAGRKFHEMILPAIEQFVCAHAAGSRLPARACDPRPPAHVRAASPGIQRVE